MLKPGFFAFKQRLRNSRLDSERLVNVIRPLIILVIGGAVGLLAVPLLPNQVQDWVSSWQQRVSELTDPTPSSNVSTPTETPFSREDAPNTVLERTPVFDTAPKNNSTKPLRTKTPILSPTPTRTIRQIFDLFDRGIISEEEAAAELNRRKLDDSYGIIPPPGVRPTVTQIPIPTQSSTQRPTPTTLPVSTPIPIQSPAQRGSPGWINQLETSIHELVNLERRNVGLITLAHDLDLTDIARSHSHNMAIKGFFDHINLIGQVPTDRADTAGYSCIKQEGNLIYTGIAENIFSGWLYSSTTRIGLISIRNYFTLAEIADIVVDGWMNSTGHRQNILTPRYEKEGIGIAINPDTEAVLVTQNFC